MIRNVINITNIQNMLSLLNTFLVMYHNILILLMFISGLNTSDEPDPLSETFINRINDNQSLWQAGVNFYPCVSVDFLLGLLGTKVNLSNRTMLSKKIYKNDTFDDLPDNFDAREKWPHCPSINQIRDQGNCGSCWAISSVEAMSDRICILSNGSSKVILSVEDVLTCTTADYGCNGGYPSDAYIFWKHKGIVTGSIYDSDQGCKPYDVAPCQHGETGNSSVKLPICGTESMPTLPACDHKCIPGYQTPYLKDKKYGDQIYSLTNEHAIKADIYSHGPVTACIEVNFDFFNYKKGIYKSTVTKSTGKHHSVKIIGWGVNSGVKYWIVSNSWNANWGDKGFMKYIRGTNQGGIESNVVAGIPLL